MENLKSCENPVRINENDPPEYLIPGAASIPVVRETDGKGGFYKRIKSELTKD